MTETQNRFWRFGVADLLAGTTVVGLWLSLFPAIRRIQPMIDPAFLAVMLSSLLGFLLAAFIGRKQSIALVVGCMILAGVSTLVIVRICMVRL